MVISRFPPGLPVTERAIPTAIFNTDPKIRDYFLRKWSRDSSITDFDIRNFIDWDYYIDRFSTTVRKIITIPAGLQGIDNPVARVKDPDWLRKVVRARRALDGQRRISDLFKVARRGDNDDGDDGDDVNDDNNDNNDNNDDNNDVNDVNNNHNNEENNEITDTTPNPITPQTTPLPRSNVKRSADFASWLALRKKQWREMRKRTRITPSSSQTYQIVEIQPSDTELALWLLTPSNQLQRLRVALTHTLYVNARRELHDPRLTSVKLDLPVESVASPFLYALTVKEKDVEATMESLRRSYDVNSIEGIYNAKLPPLMNALLTMGCVCRVQLPDAFPKSSSGILKHAVNLGSGVLAAEQIVKTAQSASYLT